MLSAGWWNTGFKDCQCQFLKHEGLPVSFLVSDHLKFISQLTVAYQLPTDTGRHVTTYSRSAPPPFLTSYPFVTHIYSNTYPLWPIITQRTPSFASLYYAIYEWSLMANTAFGQFFCIYYEIEKSLIKLIFTLRLFTKLSIQLRHQTKSRWYFWTFNQQHILWWDMYQLVLDEG